MWPGPFETVSEPDGSYRLEVYATDVWKMLAKKEGYVPFSYYGAISGRETVSVGGRIRIRSNSTTAHNVELAEIPEVDSGTASFGQFGSFLGALGLAVTDQTAGDFSYSISQQYDRDYYMALELGLTPTTEEATPKTVAYICACYDGQRGIVELGGFRSEELEEISIPPIGFVVSRNLQLTPGFVYVSKAREGLEGHFVIFRVESISEDGVIVTYLFR